MNSDFTNKRSKKPLMIIGGAVVALFVVMIAVAVALGGDQSGGNVADSQNDNKIPGVATNQEVEQGLQDLEASIKKSSTDQKSAKEALDESKDQIKVGS